MSFKERFNFIIDIAKEQYDVSKDLIKESFAFLLGFIQRSMNLKSLLTNHQKVYLDSMLIEEESVTKSYKMYHTYFVSLFVSVILFGLFVTLSLYEISLFFIGFFLILSIVIPNFLIFKQNLLSNSKLVLIIMSYTFTVFSFALIYYILQMHSIDSIGTIQAIKEMSDANQTNNIKNLAFNIINFESLKEVENFKNFGPFLYYSIVTMTTLGFGDISPISGLARVSTSIQVLFSLVYIVFGLTIVFSNKDNDKKISEHITNILKRISKK